jgi:hypothetical protein
VVQESDESLAPRDGLRQSLSPVFFDMVGSDTEVRWSEEGDGRDLSSVSEVFITRASARMTIPSLSKELPKRLLREWAEREGGNREGEVLQGFEVCGVSQRVGEWASTKGVDGVVRQTETADKESKEGNRERGEVTDSSTVRGRGLCLDLMIFAIWATPSEESALRESLSVRSEWQRGGRRRGRLEDHHRILSTSIRNGAYSMVADDVFGEAVES